ncbi:MULTISPECIES: hypothetical protein [Acinetobacter]|jgi:hypothetical protein|uniref:Uncharacterized protein n=2 Tax=Acinetobacter TaxID=469 RepID=A0A4Q7AXP3_9GAMM|nr:MULTISPECIES: hypothetical protein [Acinetobacter]MCW8039744.1 hypothetical protein [Acinetobacter entericus]RZG67373.1 hypothetical protein EXE25_07575 [Acinetobacter bouvetii]TCB74294.1 hypothetical protein E0H91_10305 [Acinetobacter sp. ANC 4177]
MKILIIPFFIMLVCILGFVVYKDTEVKRQQELNQLMNEVNQTQNVEGMDSSFSLSSAQTAEK